ncbi:MAG TPA: hypothetical protein VMG36_08430 [Thermoplasmata archaeon]|nr:hypothetical protein [Thermoplasmata archaeon]
MTARQKRDRRPNALTAPSEPVRRGLVRIFGRLPGGSSEFLPSTDRPRSEETDRPRPKRPAP